MKTKTTCLRRFLAENDLGNPGPRHWLGQEPKVRSSGCVGRKLALHAYGNLKLIEAQRLCRTFGGSAEKECRRKLKNAVRAADELEQAFKTPCPRF